MPITWNHEADAKLLRCILDVMKVKVDSAAVAQRMTEMTGEVVTVNAVTLHLARMKKKLKDGQSATDQGKGGKNADAAEGSPAAPSSRKRKNREDEAEADQSKPKKKKTKSKVKVDESEGESEETLVA